MRRQRIEDRRCRQGRCCAHGDERRVINGDVHIYMPSRPITRGGIESLVGYLHETISIVVDGQEFILTGELIVRQGS